MKKTLLLFIIIAANTCLAQNGPISFESGGFGTLWTWTVFENDNQPPLEIVDNPSAAGINLSAQVATLLLAHKKAIRCLTDGFFI